MYWTTFVVNKLIYVTDVTLWGHLRSQEIWQQCKPI